MSVRTALCGRVVVTGRLSPRHTPPVPFRELQRHAPPAACRCRSQGTAQGSAPRAGWSPGLPQPGFHAGLEGQWRRNDEDKTASADVTCSWSPHVRPRVPAQEGPQGGLCHGGGGGGAAMKGPSTPL